MKKLGVLIILLSLGIIIQARSRYDYGTDAVIDVNYADLAALIDGNDLTDPNSHDAATVADTESIDMTLTGQQIKGDVNETWLAAQSAADPNSHDAVTYDSNMATLFTLSSQVVEVNLATPADGVTKLSTADQIYDFAIALLADWLDKTTYDALEDGFVDGNNTEYGDSWEDNPDAPTMESLYDKLDTLESGTIGFASSESVTFEISDGNLVPEVNETYVTALISATGESAIKAVVEADPNVMLQDPDIGERIFSVSIPEPNATYDIDIKVPLLYGYTITHVIGITTGGTNVVALLYEVDTDGNDADKVGIETTDWTFTSTKTDDTSFNNATLDAGDWLQLDITSVSGAVTMFNLTVYGKRTL